MARRSTIRRVEEFVLFDVLYEDGSRASNRKVPGSELGGVDGDLPAKTYLKAVDRQIAEVSGKPPGSYQVVDPHASPLKLAGGAALRPYQERVQIQCRFLSETTTSMARSES